MLFWRLEGMSFQGYQTNKGVFFMSANTKKLTVLAMLTALSAVLITLVHFPCSRRPPSSSMTRRTWPSLSARSPSVLWLAWR